MAMTPFLAMTAAEVRNISTFPPKIAWMACHFSPYGLGLSNLPKQLPVGSLLMVDDITPPHGHEVSLIANQLSECVARFQCGGVLLDFQRSGQEETGYIARLLADTLPCPTAISQGYAKNFDCPVFLPPVPPSIALQEYLLPWKGREIWLELGLDGETLTLTEDGAVTARLPYPDPQRMGFPEEDLHCHYHIQTDEKSARFTLWRTEEDLMALLEEAENLGITRIVGLYQELCKCTFQSF